MNVIGETETGTPVVDGLFKFFDTSGLPLGDVFVECKNRNIQPCWISFFNEAKQAGWKDKTIILRLKDAVADAYGESYMNVVLKKLQETQLIKDLK